MKTVQIFVRGMRAAPVLEGFGNDDELDPEYAYAQVFCIYQLFHYRFAAI